MNLWDAESLESVFANRPPFFPRVYTARPYDDQISAFIKEFAASPTDVRARVTEALSQEQRCALIGFAQGMAQFAVNEKALPRLSEGLLALVAEGFREDSAESLVVLSAIYHSATILEGDPRPAFEQAIALADQSAAKHLRKFLKSPVPIKNVMLVTEEDENGFRYRAKW